MIKRTKYNISIDSYGYREEGVAALGFTYDTSDHILFLEEDNEVITPTVVDRMLGGEYSYKLKNGIIFDTPEAVITALNLFAVNCSIGFLDR